MGIKQFFKKGLNHLKHSSFRDALVHTNKLQAKPLHKSQVSNKTQLEELEQFHIKLKEGSKRLEKVPVVGSVAKQVSQGADSAVSLLHPINQAIGEQEKNVKAGKGSFKDLAKIGHSGVKGIKKAAESEYIQTEGAEQTASRYNVDLVI